MTKIRKVYEKGFTTINNREINDERLTLQAKGLFSYLWAQSDEWDFYLSEVTKHSKNGIDSTRNAMHELEQYGYLKRDRKRTNAGKYSNSDWILTDNPTLGNPTLDNPTWDNPTLEEPTLTNTNQNNKKQEQILTETNLMSVSQAKHDNAPLSGQTISLVDDCKEIVDYLNQKTGSQYRATTPKTKSLIKARIEEGFTPADFKKVIDNKVADWGNDERMKVYLRPVTLFGTKFESYLNEQPKNVKPDDDLPDYLKMF